MAPAGALPAPPAGRPLPPDPVAGPVSVPAAGQEARRSKNRPRPENHQAAIVREMFRGSTRQHALQLAKVTGGRSARRELDGLMRKMLEHSLPAGRVRTQILAKPN